MEAVSGTSLPQCLGRGASTSSNAFGEELLMQVQLNDRIWLCLGPRRGYPQARLYRSAALWAKKLAPATAFICPIRICIDIADHSLT
jgi:hypothetical protein